MKNNSKYLKAATAMTMATAVVVTAVPVATEASTLKDIKPTQYFYNDVLNLHERGIIGGFPDGTFKQGNNLTRGQAAKIIAGVLGFDTNNVVNPNFKDIPTTHQYYGAIAALKQAGIIDGYEDGTFRQGANIQRNHVAKILAGALNLNASNSEALPFTDVRADYKEAIAALYENEVTTGKTATTFDGSSNVTRGQFAAFIARAEKAAAQPAPAPVGQTVTFTADTYSVNGVSVDGKDYTFGSEVASIFTESNKAALKGALITATVNDGVMTKVNSVTLKASGTAEQPLSFSSTASIDALTVSADYVTIAGLNIAGNVTLTQQAANSVELKDVKAAGELIVDSSTVGKVASVNSLVANTGSGLKLKLTNTTVTTVQVKSNNVTLESTGTISRVVASGNVSKLTLNGNVGALTIQTISAVEVTGTGNVGELVITATTTSTVTLNIAGTITTLTVQTTTTRLVLGTSARVSNLVLPLGALVQNIITNYTQVLQQIGNVITGGGTTTETQQHTRQ